MSTTTRRRSAARLATLVVAALCGAPAAQEAAPAQSQATPALVQALDDEDVSVRWNSVVTLSKLGPHAVPPLVGALSDERARVRRGAALTLGKIGPPAKTAIPALVTALKDEDAEVRANAAAALGSMGPEARTAVGALIEALADREALVGGRAAEGLRQIGHAAVPALARALENEKENVRWGAAIALGKLGPGARDAAPALIRTLSDKNDNVRWCATLALGAVGAPARAAVPALLQSLSDRDEEVRWAAAWALEKIDPAVREAARTLDATVAAIDALVPRLMSELHVPGVSIALVHDRTLAWTKSYGVADASTRAPLTGDTVFEAASMSKPVFAYSVLKLVEQGKLDLDRPLDERLKESYFPDQTGRRLLTARMALSHTTGLPNWRRGEEEWDGPLPLTVAPGAAFVYSGEGFFCLQHVVEQITGEPLEVYARRTLFDPLGLKSTSYIWTEDIDSRLASGHDADGALVPRTRYTRANAAYTLYTTVSEYAAFLVEIMKRDRSAPHSLSRRSIDAMLAHQVEVDARAPIGRPGKAAGLATYWGLGWSINATVEGDIIHHSGGNRTGFRGFTQFSPRRGAGIVIMTNGMGGAELWSRLISAVGDF